MTIVNDDSRVVNKLKVSLTDDATVIIYDRPMFIVQATAVGSKQPEVDHPETRFSLINLQSRLP
jgi:hypothetical protein